MKVVVTGGAGFIGSNLVRALLNLGTIEVVVIDDLSTGSGRNLEGLDLELRTGSVLDGPLLARALHGAHSVVHLAALGSVPRSVANPDATHEANATGTLRVLEAARTEGTHVIVASSSSVYGGNPVLPRVESLRPQPMSPYAVSKLAAECYALSFQQVYGLPTLALRFFNVYGPRQSAGHAYAAVVPTFVSRALQGQPLVIHGDGQQTRDFTFVDSVVEVLVAAASSRRCSSDPVNVAFGIRSSILEVAELVAQAANTAVDLEHVDPRPGDVRDSQGDNSRLRALFPGIAPTSLADGVARTVAWARTQSAADLVTA